MTIDSLIAELSKFPLDYEVIIIGEEKVSEREVNFIISHRERFVILKYKSLKYESYQKEK